MAPNANKPGPKIPLSAEDRRSPVRKAHDVVTATEEDATPGASNGGSAAENGSEPSSPARDRDPKPSKSGGKKKTATTAPTGAAKTAGKSAAKTAGKLFEATSPIGGGAAGKAFRAVARRSGRRVAETLVSKAIPAGAQTARKLSSWVGGSSREAIMDRARQLPIQRSVDVAVPLEVAWGQWMKFDYLPEGAHRVKDVERDGDHLVGQVASPAGDGWEAEIIEERPEESFAWQSIDGSDCAGLVTFHRLSDRLTRIELNLDVRPSGLAEALALSLHLADRRAEADLHRFKAQAELLNPDTYQDIVDDSGDEREAD